jgi:hypothetical protein
MNSSRVSPFICVVPRDGAARHNAGWLPYLAWPDTMLGWQRVFFYLKERHPTRSLWCRCHGLVVMTADHGSGYN